VSNKPMVAQPPASQQYGDWKKWPGTYREPTHEEWLLEVDIHKSLRNQWQTFCVTAIAAENPSVRDYIATLESEVAALRAEVEGMRDNAERYEVVRRMHAEQFARIFKRNIQENIPFDDLIDVWRKESSNG